TRRITGPASTTSRTRTTRRARRSPTRCATSARSSPASPRCSSPGSRTSRSAARTRSPTSPRRSPRRGPRTRAASCSGTPRASTPPRASVPAPRRRFPGWTRRICSYRDRVAVTRTIRLKTQIPGPRSQEILARKDLVVAEPLSVYLPVVAAEGRGATLTDVDGNTFIDFAGGVGCLNVGHAHPHLVEAVQEQAARFFHTDFTIIPYEVYVTLAERLLALTPITGETRAAFFNAGTEAVENAVKFARAYTRRPAVIAFEGGFHGRTLLSLTLTSKTHPYKAGLGPFAPEVYRVPFAQDYRGPDTRTAIAALERALITQVAAETVAAIVVEPVQGEGGFVVAPADFLAGLRRICDDNGIVLVVDEVQTGFARTGKFLDRK